MNYDEATPKTKLVRFLALLLFWLLWLLWLLWVRFFCLALNSAAGVVEIDVGGDGKSATNAIPFICVCVCVVCVHGIGRAHNAPIHQYLCIFASR